MPMFSFQAKTLDGQNHKGQIEASTEVEARVKLRAQQMIPVQVSLAGDSGGAKGGMGGFLVPKVKPKDLQVFTRQFSTLINSGIPVVQSLEILEQASGSEVLKASVRQVKSDISSGRKLADAMEQHPKVFDRLYVNLVRAGEEGGVLDTILNRLATYIEKSVKIRNKVIGALYYPAGIVFVASIVIFAILTFVIPKFEELFKGSGQELPTPTQIVIDMSHAVQSYWHLIILTIGGGIFFFVQYYATPAGKRTMDAVFLTTPVFGSLLQKSAIARFSSTLSTLLGCGVAILDALDIAAKVAGNAVMEETLMKAKAVIAQGKSITMPLSQDKYIPDMVVQMVGVGEQTGALDTMLGKIAEFYEEEVDYAVGALTSVIEPLMMVFLGGIIGGLVISMYLPVFNLANTVK